MRPNKDSYISGATAIGLFSTTILYTILLYTLVTLVLLIGIYLENGEITPQVDKSLYMACYRIFEIVFDIFLLFYSLVLSKWKMTDLTTATTVIAYLDIFFNISLFFKNACDSLDNDDL